MDKLSFSESDDLVCSLPKDWLNLWPPSSSGGVGYPFHCLDFQNSLASFDTRHRSDHPLSPPLMGSGDWSNMPFSWPCPSARQDNLKTTLMSHPDEIVDNIKKNDHLDEDQSDCFHMTQTPDVTETRDTPSCDRICGLTLCTGTQCDNFNSNVCFGDQATKLPLLFTDSDQGIHLSAGNGCNKHVNGSHQFLTEDIPLNFQELLHQDVDSDDSYPLYDGSIYSNECCQVRVGPILHGIHEFPLQGSLESSMMVSGPENNYWGFTYTSCNSITNSNCQEKLKMNCKVPHNQLQASIQFSEFSSEGTTDDWCSPVQDDFSTDTAVFPDQGSLTEDCLLPRSKMSSYPLYENTGSASIPQVTEGLIESDNICGKGKCDCLPCSIHATIGSQFDSVDWWCQRKIDEKVSKASNSAGHTSCIGFDYSQKMHTQDKNRADDTRSSAANSKHCLMNSEPEKSGLDQLDSVTDCHNLVENIWSSSLMLFASHSCESDRLAELDVEILLSVIHSLSNYLTSRAGVSAKCIQAAAQPDKSHFGDDSSINEKVSKLAECYHREIDAADYETQVSKSSDICSALRGIHVAEGGSYMSDIIAESGQMQGIYYKKAKLSDLEKERESKKAICELQALVKKLRDDFEFEIKERDAAIILYKDFWSEAQAKLSTAMSEMEHIKTKVEALKKKQFNTDAAVLDVIGGGTCKIRERAGLETCLEVNLNKKENVMDQAAIYQGKYHKEPDTNSSISPRDIVSKENDERAFWERAAVLISREEGLRETCKVEEKPSSICPVADDLNPERNVTDQAAMYQGKDPKELDMNTSLIPPTDIVSKAYDERAFWERAAVLISREEGLRETYKIDEKTSFLSPVEDDLNLERNVTDQAAMYQGKDHKEPDMNTSSISPTDIISKAYDERNFWERAAVLISREEGLEEKTSYICPVEDDLNLESNITEQAAMLPSFRKDCEESQTKTNSNSLINVTSQLHCEDSYWERAANLFSCEQSLGISEISRDEYYFDNDIQEVSPEREDIIRRFKVLQEYKQSDMVGRDSGKQVEEAKFDVSGSLNNSFHLEEIIADDLNPESCKSNQVLYRAGEGTFQERASLLLSREKIQTESVTSETNGKANSECPIKNNLYPKLNVIDQTTTLSHENVSESPVTNKNINCLRNIIPQECNEVWKQAAIMFSSQECHGESDGSGNLIMCNQDTMERAKILCRFKTLQERSHHSNITVRDSGKQFGEASFHESGSCNCSHVEENVSNDLNTESYKSNQDNSQAIQCGGFASQNVYPNTDEVQERFAVLYRREASGGEMEDFHTVLMSNYFEKQASCMLASEDIHDIVSSAYGTEHFSNPHLGLKSYMIFGREEFPCIVPATESSSKESTLIRSPSILSQSESFSSISAPDVYFSIDSQSINFVQPISKSYGDVNDTFTAEYSGTASESGNDFIMDGHNQILSAGSSSIPKLDLDKKDIIGMQNQNCSNPSRDSADAECLNQELGCISECQHDIGQDTFSCEMESSSSDSESSWQYVEEEEVSSFPC